MDKCFKDALKLIKDGIDLMLQADDVKVEKTQEIPFNDTTNYEKIAVRIAETYSTFRPEFGAIRLASDIIKMANNADKVNILISWMRKKGIDGFEDFFKQSKEKQQEIVIKAVTANKDKIINILKTRF